MRSNRKSDVRKSRTHEGGRAHSNLTPLQQLRRSVLSCLLFENEFYEDGQSIADRIKEYASIVTPEQLAEVAIEARHQYNLRHVPLLLLRVLVRTGADRTDGLVRSTIPRVISRADELAEFVSLYWKDGKEPLSGQTKKGLAAAFRMFDAYQLAKYNRDYAVKLRDVMFMAHPKPIGEKQAAVFKKLADQELESPDTWEVALSGGADKKETFERLIHEGNLGYMALLRNLRGMAKAGVDLDLVREALLKGKTDRVLPFRFVAAARECPQLEPELDQALLAKIKMETPFAGKTIVLVDVSGSMGAKLSSRSDLSRMDAAATLASVLPGNIRVFSFSDGATQRYYQRPLGRVLVEVPPRKGMAGIDAIIKSQAHNGTMLGKAVQEANELDHDRLIVITDEQSHDAVPDPVAKRAYMINVASAKNGVGYGRWVHIDGFSERVIHYIKELESHRD